MPDPDPITLAIWADINDWLLFLGIYLIFIVTFAFSLLVGLAVIPSLVSTGHLSDKALKLRPAIVVFSLVAFMAAASFMGLVIAGYQGFDNFWERWFL